MSSAAAKNLHFLIATFLHFIIGADRYAEKPPLSWAIIRNIPFAILGGIIVVLFASTGSADGPFRLMPVAVTLSFVFYLIVVLFTDKNKKLGMFMLPKTCMYIWIICMGFGLL